MKRRLDYQWKMKQCFNEAFTPAAQSTKENINLKRQSKRQLNDIQSELWALHCEALNYENFMVKLRLSVMKLSWQSNPVAVDILKRQFEASESFQLMCRFRISHFDFHHRFAIFFIDIIILQTPTQWYRFQMAKSWAIASFSVFSAQKVALSRWLFSQTCFMFELLRMQNVFPVARKILSALAIRWVSWCE